MTGSLAPERPRIDESSLRTLWERSFPPGMTWAEGSSERSYGVAATPPVDGTRPAGDAAGDQVTGASPPRFRLGGRLDSGGMGVIWRAEQAGLDRVVALKRLPPGHDGDGERALFLAEARLTGVLEHPNIVPVHDLGHDRGGGPFLAMKLVAGRTWRDAIRAGERDIEAAIAIALQVGNALAFAHAQGVAHCDLKPANVMLGAFGEVQVLDWGLAVAFRADACAPAPRAAAIAGPVGTPAYMPSELALGRGGDVGPWTDVYLLAAALLEALTGMPPHRGDSLWDVVRSAAAGQLPELPADLPPSLRAVLRRALARSPGERFAGMPAFQAALRAVLRHRQSDELVRHAEAALAAPAPAPAAAASVRYAPFLEALSALRQAQAVWEDNPAARDGERRARLAFAAHALAAGDIVLAEQQLAHCPPHDPALAPLVQEVGARRAARARADRHARALRRALATSLAVIVVGLATGLLALRSERDAARAAQAEEARSRASADHERAAAESERRRAEDITGFMLLELRRELEGVGRLDLLRAVADKAEDHYANRDPSRLRPEERLKHAAALDSLAAVLADQGRPGDAEGLLTQAVALADRAAGHSGDRAAADLRRRLALTRIELRLPRAPLAEVRGELAACRADHEAALVDGDIATHVRLARIDIRRCELELAAGDRAAAEACIAQALAGAARIAATQPGHAAAKEIDIDARLVAGEAALALGGDVLAVVRPVLDGFPDVHSDRTEVAWYWRLAQAQHLHDAVDTARAATASSSGDLAMRSLGTFEILLQRGGRRPDWVRGQARALALYAEQSRLRRSDGPAGELTRPLLRRAIGLLDQLVQADPAHRIYAWDAIQVRRQLAARLRAVRMDAQAAAVEAEALDRCRALVACHPDHAAARRMLAEQASATQR